MIFTNNLLANIQPMDPSVFANANPAVQVTAPLDASGVYQGIQAANQMQQLQLQQQEMMMQQERFVAQQQQVKQQTVQRNMALMQGIQDDITGIQVNARDAEEFAKLKDQYGINQASIQKASGDVNAMEELATKTFSLMNDQKVQRMVRDKSTFDQYAKQFDGLAAKGQIGEDEFLEYSQILADYNSGGTDARIENLNPNSFINFKRQEKIDALKEQQIQNDAIRSKAQAQNAATQVSLANLKISESDARLQIDEMSAKAKLVTAQSKVPDGTDLFIGEVIRNNQDENGNITADGFAQINQRLSESPLVEDESGINKMDAAKAFTFAHLVEKEGVAPLKALEMIEASKKAGKIIKDSKKKKKSTSKKGTSKEEEEEEGFFSRLFGSNTTTPADTSQVATVPSLFKRVSDN